MKNFVVCRLENLGRFVTHNCRYDVLHSTLNMAIGNTDQIFAGLGRHCSADWWRPWRSRGSVVWVRPWELTVVKQYDAPPLPVSVSNTNHCHLHRCNQNKATRVDSRKKTGWILWGKLTFNVRVHISTKWSDLNITTTITNIPTTKKGRKKEELLRWRGREK